MPFFSILNCSPETFPGREFTIEWYYDERGQSGARDYFDNLVIERRKKAFYLFRTMGDLGEILNIEKFKNEGDQIYAFKPSPDRFLCFFIKGSKIIITNAFHKKGDKLPQGEKERALKYKESYLKRIKLGNYYE